MKIRRQNNRLFDLPYLHRKAAVDHLANGNLGAAYDELNQALDDYEIVIRESLATAEEIAALIEQPLQRGKEAAAIREVMAKRLKPARVTNMLIDTQVEYVRDLIKTTQKMQKVLDSDLPFADKSALTKDLLNVTFLFEQGLSNITDAVDRLYDQNASLGGMNDALQRNLGEGKKDISNFTEAHRVFPVEIARRVTSHKAEVMAAMDVQVGEVEKFAQKMIGTHRGIAAGSKRADLANVTKHTLAVVELMKNSIILDADLDFDTRRVTNIINRLNFSSNQAHFDKAYNSAVVADIVTVCVDFMNAANNPVHKNSYLKKIDKMLCSIEIGVPKQGYILDKVKAHINSVSQSEVLLASGFVSEQAIGADIVLAAKLLKQIVRAQNQGANYLLDNDRLTKKCYDVISLNNDQLSDALGALNKNDVGQACVMLSDIQTILNTQMEVLKNPDHQKRLQKDIAKLMLRVEDVISTDKENIVLRFDAVNCPVMADVARNLRKAKGSLIVPEEATNFTENAMIKPAAGIVKE